MSWQFPSGDDYNRADIRDTNQRLRDMEEVLMFLARTDSRLHRMRFCTIRELLDAVRALAEP